MRTQSKIATAIINREANDPAPRAGRTHAEMEASAVAVATRPGLPAHLVSETEEPATDALDACPNEGDTGRQIGH